jgi:amidophosphoribosyltransferase
MCGIIGIAGNTPVNQQLFDGLTVLQHRGQDAAGISTASEGNLILRKHNGLVREVFRTKHMVKLKGNMGIGHVRYPTAGSPSAQESQPFYVNSPFGITLAHNGNLTNAKELKKELFFQDQRHINTNSDSEVLLNILAQELTKRSTPKLKVQHVFDATCNLFDRCDGAFSVVAMIVDHGIVAFRDPYGIRPLIVGKRGENEYCVASESVALDTLGFEPIRDVRPGEVIYITKEGEFNSFQCTGTIETSPIPDLFEYVYLARPDSIIDEVYVHKARMRMGKLLAKKLKREWPEYKEMFDVVIPIPTTSRIIALEMAKHLKKSFREGFVKNRYIGRTFIMPEQSERKRNVRAKLNPLRVEFKNKNVLLVDDSIVRGTTSREIIEMVRQAGANQVYLASAAPPIRHPNVYGIDMPASEELIAYGKDVEKIREELNADGLIYQDLEDLILAVQSGNEKLTEFETSVFTGEYITGIDKEYFVELAEKRNNESKIKQFEEDEEYDI